MNPAPPVMSRVPMLELRTGNSELRTRSSQFQVLRSELNRSPFRVHQRQAQFLRQRIDRGARALPRAFGLEAQVADAAAPRRDDAADGAEVRAVGVLLIEALDHLGRDADE